MRKDIDECLFAYLHSTDEAGQQQHLAYLVNEVATPIIQQVLHRAFQQDYLTDAYGIVRVPGEDAVADVVLKILNALHAFKSKPIERAITNFRGFVATTAYRMVADQLREHHRERANHAQKIRRLFASINSLAIWKDSSNTTICGRTKWQVAKTNGFTYPSRDELLSVADQLRATMPGRSTAELILLLLDQIEKPVQFGDLVGLTFACQRKDTHRLVGESTELGLRDGLCAVSENPSVVLEARLLLDRLFSEIQKLRPVQRKALLLNMSDSQGDGIQWFLFANIATEEQMAALLEVSVGEFRQLLEHLPMTDKEIGRQIGIDAVKVANIRKAVRDRLERRRRAFLGESGRLASKR